MTPQQPPQPQPKTGGKGGIAAVFLVLCAIALFFGWKIVQTLGREAAPALPEPQESVTVQIIPPSAQPPHKKLSVEEYREAMKCLRIIRAETLPATLPKEIPAENHIARHNWQIWLNNQCEKPIRNFSYSVSFMDEQGAVMVMYGQRIHYLAQGEKALTTGVQLMQGRLERVKTAEFSFWTKEKSEPFYEFTTRSNGEKSLKEGGIPLLATVQKKPVIAKIPTVKEVEEELARYRDALKEETAQPQTSTSSQQLPAPEQGWATGKSPTSFWNNVEESPAQEGFLGAKDVNQR